MRSVPAYPFVKSAQDSSMAVGVPAAAASSYLPTLVRIYNRDPREGGPSEALIATDRFPIEPGTEARVRLSDGRMETIIISYSDCQEVVVRREDAGLHWWLGLTKGEFLRSNFRLFGSSGYNDVKKKRGHPSVEDRLYIRRLSYELHPTLAPYFEEMFSICEAEMHGLLWTIAETLVRATPGQREVWERWGLLPLTVRLQLDARTPLVDFEFDELALRIAQLFRYHHERGKGLRTSGQRETVAKQLIPPFFADALYDRYVESMPQLRRSDVAPFIQRNDVDPEAGVQQMLAFTIWMETAFNALEFAKYLGMHRGYSDLTRQRVDRHLERLSFTREETLFLSRKQKPMRALRSVMERYIALAASDPMWEFRQGGVFRFYQRIPESRNLLTAAFYGFELTTEELKYFSLRRNGADVGPVWVMNRAAEAILLDPTIHITGNSRFINSIYDRLYEAARCYLGLIA